MLGTQVPGCLYASPCIYHAGFTPGKTGHLLASCLSRQGQTGNHRARETGFDQPTQGKTFIRRAEYVISTSTVQMSATCFVCLKHFSR